MGKPLQQPLDNSFKCSFSSLYVYFNALRKWTSLGTMIQPLTFPNGYLTMIYGHGDKSSLCDNLTTTIQFVCDNVVPGGVGVSRIVSNVVLSQLGYYLSEKRKGPPYCCQVSAHAQFEKPQIYVYCACASTC